MSIVLAKQHLKSCLSGRRTAVVWIYMCRVKPVYREYRSMVEAGVANNAKSVVRF